MTIDFFLKSLSMKQFTFLLILFFIVSGVSAQKTLSLKDAILGASSYLKPQMPEQIKWRDAHRFVMVKDSILLQQEIQKNNQSNILSLSELNTALKTDGIKVVKSFPRFSFINPSQIWFRAANQIVILNIDTKKVNQNIEYPENAENLDFCTANTTLAYTVNNNLFATGTSGVQQITKDQNQHIINGKAVHRNEFGIDKGTFWSPAGTKLAFYHMDETMVGDYPLVDYMTREAELVNIKYPMAGMTSHQVKLGIYDRTTKQTVYLKTGEPLDHYLTNICWSPDEKSIFIQELNREQNHMKLNQYDVATGDLIRTVLEEQDDKYVEPVHPILFSKIDPEKFYYQSRRDGWNHVYQCTIKDGIVAQITKGDWEVTELSGFDAKEENMFFEATKESPIERHVYRINLRSGKTDKLTAEAGTHSGILSPDQQNAIDRWTSTNNPGQLDLISVKKNSRQVLSQAENTLKDFDLGENTVFTIKAADGATDLYCRMIKPNNFDPAKKYPVIVYVYGGPHAQLVNKTWQNDARWWQYYMASKGYIAFTVDSRGSENRGKSFENVIHRQLGIIETADQMKGIDYLKSLPYIDANRIGVHGWSYGGFMTLNLKLKYPETFKVAVAGGPVVDWSMYEVMYGERYMDTPQENPEGYKDANMLNYVDKLSGKLMIIHGAQDQTVVMQQSMQFLKKCIDLNKQVDFFVYPTHEHNVRGIDRIHLMEKVSNYFQENL
ncbi:dipeptidyl peptidase IV [Aquipluma nitroreducens]|uniref:Dipeptidyl peptidase IV n=2 Tax=Aquipluma nitroreducens TaxID=2010828 RepID=A0A5K7SEN0_9BACT|nr:dipeptidyl peptidase IV [Aquipluma nitroreducens]